MHIRIDARLLLVLLLSSTTKYVNSANLSDDSSNYRSRAILVGYGYSTDSQQVTNQACFNVTLRKISDQTTRIELQQTVSISELQKTFGVDLSVKGGYGLFASDAKSEYLRSIQESESSVSLNYYVVNQEEVTVNINGLHDQALNSFGRQLYHDESLNKYFGLQCGDYYIASYKQGAVLFVGLNIILTSKEEKIKLEGSIGASYGSFANVAAKIQSVSNEKQISGQVQIRAYQFGGEPAELTGIMSENIANCNIRDMSECNKVVKDLLAYAKVFGNQIKNGKGLRALGSFDFVPIVRLGLDAPPSLVTPKITQCRKDLAHKLMENQYYARKLLPLASNEYPVRLEDKLIAHIKSLFHGANHNVELIMDSQKGAVRCFNTPEKCGEIKTEIYENLKNITSSDLKFLKYMKYIVSIKLEILEELYYNTGEGIEKWSICLDIHPTVPCQHQDNAEMVMFNLSEKKNFEYQLKTVVANARFNGTWVQILQAYQGVLSSFEKNEWKVFKRDFVQPLYSSPFFFEEYNSSIDAALNI